MCAKRFHKLIAGQTETDRIKYRYGMAGLIQAEELPGFKPVPNWELSLVSSIHSKKRDVIEVKYMFGKRVIRPIKVRSK
jgi:hypothetical protein